MRPSSPLPHPSDCMSLSALRHILQEHQNRNHSASISRRIALADSYLDSNNQVLPVRCVYGSVCACVSYMETGTPRPQTYTPVVWVLGHRLGNDTREIGRHTSRRVDCGSWTRNDGLHDVEEDACIKRKLPTHAPAAASGAATTHDTDRRVSRHPRRVQMLWSSGENRQRHLRRYAAPRNAPCLTHRNMSTPTVHTSDRWSVRRPDTCACTALCHVRVTTCTLNQVITTTHARA